MPTPGQQHFSACGPQTMWIRITLSLLKISDSRYNSCHRRSEPLEMGPGNVNLITSQVNYDAQYSLGFFAISINNSIYWAPTSVNTASDTDIYCLFWTILQNPPFYSHFTTEGFRFREVKYLFKLNWPLSGTPGIPSWLSFQPCFSWAPDSVRVVGIF